MEGLPARVYKIKIENYCTISLTLFCTNVLFRTLRYWTLLHRCSYFGVRLYRPMGVSRHFSCHLLLETLPKLHLGSNGSGTAPGTPVQKARTRSTYLVPRRTGSHLHHPRHHFHCSHPGHQHVGPPSHFNRQPGRSPSHLLQHDQRLALDRPRPGRNATQTPASSQRANRQVCHTVTRSTQTSTQSRTRNIHRE